MHTDTSIKCEPDSPNIEPHLAAFTTRRVFFLCRAGDRNHCRASAPCCELRGILAIAVLLAVTPSIVSARQSEVRMHRVTVRFVATSTTYRTTWGMDEDIYLANLTFPKNGERVLARLIDEYPNYAPSIPEAALRSGAGTPFYVVRDTDCDIAFGEMPLRTAPGDPMAILPERLGYRPHLKKTPAPSEVLPCYRIETYKRSRVARLLSAIFPWSKG